MSDTREVYVSVTGLRLKGWLQIIPFFWHAIPSLQQAQKADGNLLAEVRMIAGTRHTFSVWTDEAAMRAFLVKGAHLKALRAFRRLASGRTYGYRSIGMPSWDEAYRRWQDFGRDY